MALVRCPECGTEINENLNSCPNCGYPIQSQTRNTVDNEIHSEKIGLSIASMVLGIVSILTICVWIGVIPAIIGLVLGIIVLKQKRKGKGMAIAGIAMSALAILIVVMMFVWFSNSSKGISEGHDNNKEELKQEQEIIDGFERAEYDKFNSYASENGLDGTLIYIEEKVINQTKINSDEGDPPLLAIVVEQEDKNRWDVNVPSESEIEEIGGENVRIFGTYQGFSDVLNLPAVSVVVDDYEIMDLARIDIKKDDGKYETVWNFGDYVNSNIDTDDIETDEKVYLTDEEIPQFFLDPDSFKGKYIKLTGEVFTAPQDTGEYVELQVWNDPENSKNNFLVKAPKDGTEYTSESYVVVDGKIEGMVTGTNLVGGIVSAPIIDAEKVEISSYKDVVRPTIKECEFDALTIDQYGYSVSIDKVEYAELETRIYITVKNNGGSKFSIFSYSAKLIQNGQQYETETNFYADYPDLQSEVLPGTESSGVLVFPTIDANTDFQFYAEGYSENWEEDIQPYQLSVAVQN